MPPSPIVRSKSDTYCVASWNGILLQLWLKGTPLSGVREVRRLAREMGDSLRGTLVVIGRDAYMPDEAARAELAAFTKESVPRMARSAMVFEGDGFRASVVRSIMVGLAAAARIGVKYKIFANVAEAAAWMTEEPALDLAPGSLEAAVRDLRREHGAP